MTPEGMEALAQNNFEEYSAIEDELSDAEQAQLDMLITWATKRFGIEVVNQTELAVASAMEGESPANIERALIRTLQEEYDNDQSNEGTQQATEGQARPDNPSGREEDSGRRNDANGEEGNGREGGRGSARDGQEQTVNQQDGKTVQSNVDTVNTTEKRVDKTQDNRQDADLLGDNTAAKQAIADAERAKDAKRNSGESNTDGFTLTGSNSEADKAAAMGAQDLFSQPTATKPKAAAKEEQKPDESGLKDTSDVGVEMLGNRRSKGLTMKDILNAENDTARVALAVKEKLWGKPDYQALVDSGVQPVIAHLVKQLYDSLSTKPAYQGENYLLAYVNTVELAKKAVDDFLADKNAMVKMIIAVATKAKKQSYMLSGAGNGIGVAISELSGNEVGEEDTAIFDYFLDRIFPKNAQGHRWGRGNTEGNEKANATGKRFYREVQVNLSNFIDAMKAVEAGWPAKQEAWQRSYVIKEKDGKFQVVKKNRYSPTSEHETREQAVNAARELVKRTREAEFVEPDTPIEKATRIGREIRKGNISSEELKTTIGLKAVNFGNWMQQATNAKERQQHVNSAYDAFFDLSEALNLPIKAMSLNGMLGLAIGAQGKGKYAAHFYPGFNEINLTREKGAGSLAHEWAHGLDHYFGVQAGLAAFDEPFASWADNHSRRIKAEDVTIRPEVVNAFRTIVKTMKRKQETIEEVKNRVESDAKSAQEQFDKYLGSGYGAAIIELAKSDKDVADALQSIRDGAESDYVVWPPLKGKRKLQGYTSSTVKLIADKLGLDYTKANELNGHAVRISYTKAALASEPKQRELHTNFYRSASILDANKKDAYWSTNHELFARAFEMYVADKIADKDWVNNYLVSAWKLNTDATESTGNDFLDMIRDQARARYPIDEDRKAINAAFDVLFNEIRTKETDDGNVALFSRSNATKNIPDAIILNDLGTAKNNKDYELAKSGDIEAATRLAKVLVTDDVIKQIKSLSENSDYIVGVTSIESSGNNALPEAAAILIADKLGVEYDKNILQSTSPKRTGMDGLDRIFNRPVFNGDVVSGAGYIFVDDTITQGGTFAALSAHISSGGGNVVANIALTGKQYSSKIAQSDEQLSRVRQKFGDIENEFKQSTGYDFTGLTASESRYVTLGIPAEKFRSRVIAESQKATSRTNYQASQKDLTNPALSRFNSTGGLSKSDVEKTVNSLKYKWKNAPNIIVVDDMNDPAIREAVRKENERQLSQGAQGQPEGFFDNGAVYIVASELKNEKDVARVLFHEALGHYGLRGLYGAELGKILNQVSLLRKRDMQAKAKAYGLDLTKETDKHIAAEEILAEMAQKSPEIGFVKRAIAAIRNFLRSIGVNLELTDNDIINNYLLPARNYVVNGARGNIGDGAALSRTNQTETEAFLKWFGDSKVVDADGKPLVVYHGTSRDIVAFNSSEKGTLGKGIYFADSKRNAGDYGDTIIPVVLKIENPWVIALDYESDRALAEDFDSPSVDAVLTLPNGRAMLNKAKATDGMYASDMQAAVKALGHDGIIGTYPDGSMEYVVFTPNQIKSATGNNGNFDANNNDIRLSRSNSTKQAYETRIDELFNGKAANREGAVVLDSSDVLDMLGYGNKPVHLVEHKVISGQSIHQLTAEHWKKIPDWLENPAAVFDSDTVKGSLVFIAPELYKGAPIRMIVEPNVRDIKVNLLISAYDAGGKNPAARWVRDGLLRYIDKAKSHNYLKSAGLQLPSTLSEARGLGRKILVDSDLVKYRENNAAKFNRASGNSTGLSQSINQPLAEKLNRGMVRYFNDEDWSNAYVTTDMLSSLGELAAAAEAAFGGKVEAIKPTAEKFNIFNGINFGGTNYINVDANVGFINIVGHELYHQIEKERPDLHQWFSEQARKYAEKIAGIKRERAYSCKHS